MIDKNRTIIYLNSFRGLSEFPDGISYHVFNYKNYIAENREPVGDILGFNQSELKPNGSLKIQIEIDCLLILMPIVGSIDCNFLQKTEISVDVDEVLCDQISQGQEIEFSNPYETTNVKFLWFFLDKKVENQIHKFDILSNKNKLIPVTSKQFTLFQIGLFDGRMEVIVDRYLHNKESFFYVIQGAFEVHNRLLHEGDALFVSGIEELEFESLSNDAIILVI